MPTYQYKCACGNRMEIVLRMKDHVNKWPCSVCGEDAPQVIIFPPMMIIPAMMQAGFNGYESPVDGRVIRNKKERAEDLARNGCIEYDPEMRTDYKRRIAESESKLERSIDETVEREIATMPTIKRERLDAELSRGASAEIIRQTS